MFSGVMCFFFFLNGALKSGIYIYIYILEKTCKKKEKKNKKKKKKMPVSSKRKRERSLESNGRSNGKKPRNDTPLERYYTLDEAKKGTAQDHRTRTRPRIYQVEEWNYNFSKTYQPFVVANREELCDQFILDGETHVNVKEYYPGDERCPLVFDIEWYYSHPDDLSQRLERRYRPFRRYPGCISFRGDGKGLRTTMV